MSGYLLGTDYTPSGGDLLAFLRSRLPRASGSSAVSGAGLVAADLMHYVILGTGLFDGSLARVAEYFIRFGSGSQVCAALPRNVAPISGVEAGEPQAHALSASDQTRELLAALSLNKSQLADIMRVSRQTVYEWLDEKEPASSNQERLTAILRVLARAMVTSSAPLNAKLVRFPMPDETTSLVDLLSAELVDDHLLETLLRKARELTQEMKNRREQREQRLRRLGFQEATDDQKRHRLDRNLAMITKVEP